ncbi:hypothetical protein CEXT_410261, partial [Caerostris extrusa]
MLLVISARNKTNFTKSDDIRSSEAIVSFKTFMAGDEKKL